MTTAMTHQEIPSETENVTHSDMMFYFIFDFRMGI